MSPTGPKIKFFRYVDKAKEVISEFRQMLVNVQQQGSDIVINYTLPTGEVHGFTFEGKPYKGKPIAQIDAALLWETQQFAKRMGWE